MNAKLKFSLTCLSIAATIGMFNPQAIVGAVEVISAYKSPTVEKEQKSLFTVTTNQNSCDGKLTVEKGECQILAVKAIANEVCKVHNPNQGYSDCMNGATRRIKDVIDYVVIDKLDRTNDSFDLVDIDYKGCSSAWCTDASGMLKSVYLSLR